jgi:anionic cell wall polymer biosynthesis LytR-Cps2A-Psr (LCP) family protein
MNELSENTETGDVHLISLPRDTYAKIPGVSGIYKLNASIDCGGGWPTQSGFEKVCEAASWMLGGIPVEYYYAVDMSAFKELVDSIDGVRL